FVMIRPSWRMTIPEPSPLCVWSCTTLGSSLSATDSTEPGAAELDACLAGGGTSSADGALPTLLSAGRYPPSAPAPPPPISGSTATPTTSPLDRRGGCWPTGGGVGYVWVCAGGTYGPGAAAP